MKDDKLYLIHISECIQRIGSYVDRLDKDAFLKSPLVQDAVIRNLQVMAESTQRLSDNLKEQHSKIEWHKIAGFRNLLVHDYLGVDLERIWNIIQKDLPILTNAIRSMISQ